MPPHPVTNCTIQRYYQSEIKFNVAYSRNNLPKIKNGKYAIIIDEFKSIGTHRIALHVTVSYVT